MNWSSVQPHLPKLNRSFDEMNRRTSFDSYHSAFLSQSRSSPSPALVRSKSRSNSTIQPSLVATPTINSQFNQHINQSRPTFFNNSTKNLLSRQKPITRSPTAPIPSIITSCSHNKFDTCKLCRPLCVQTTGLTLSGSNADTSVNMFIEHPAVNAHCLSPRPRPTICAAHRRKTTLNLDEFLVFMRGW